MPRHTRTANRKPRLHSHSEWNIQAGYSVEVPRSPMSLDTLTPLLKGTVDLLILQSLRQGPQHGYEVSRWVREGTDEVLAVEDAALYQALHRLEDRGWIESEWGLSENNRRAKYYQLTAVGRRELRNEVSQWKRYAEAVFKAIQTA
jgi:PadR family transcriptional regulator PadR